MIQTKIPLDVGEGSELGRNGAGEKIRIHLQQSSQCRQAP